MSKKRVVILTLGVALVLLTIAIGVAYLYTFPNTSLPFMNDTLP